MADNWSSARISHLQQRYARDAEFHRLVDAIVLVIEDPRNFSLDDVRQAVLLIKYEQCRNQQRREAEAAATFREMADSPYPHHDLTGDPPRGCCYCHTPHSGMHKPGCIAIEVGPTLANRLINDLGKMVTCDETGATPRAVIGTFFVGSKLWYQLEGGTKVPADRCFAYHSPDPVEGVTIDVGRIEIDANKVRMLPNGTVYLEVPNHKALSRPQGAPSARASRATFTSMDPRQIKLPES